MSAFQPRAQNTPGPPHGFQERMRKPPRTTARHCAFTLRRATENTEDTEVYTEKFKKR